jgi:tetratricopeptide (TPR) repeat protein
LMLGNIAQAEAGFREALALRADYGLARQGLALALEAQGRFEESATEFAILVKQLPTAETHYNFGALRHRQHEWDAALAEYREALRLDSNYAEAHFGAGLTLLAVGRDRDAVASLRRAHAIRPSWGAVAEQLAWTLATSADDGVRSPGEAVSVAEAAAAGTAGRTAHLLDVLAAAQAAAGHFAEAVRTAESALKALTPADPQSLGAEITGRLEQYRRGQPYRDAAVGPKENRALRR